MLLAYHLSTSSDVLVKLCYKLDQLLPTRSSILARARDYCVLLSLTVDFHSCDLVRLKKSICTKQYDQLISSLTIKPLHGLFHSLFNDASIDNIRSFSWLKHHIHSESESTIFAIQDQAISTRVIEAKIMYRPVPSVLCRVCGRFEESIVHLLAACPLLAASAYLYRHNLVAGALHWHLHCLSLHCLYIVVFDYLRQLIFFLEVSCSC